MTATISKNIGKEDSSLEDNFLAAFHTLRISKVNKEATEIADIERRCLSIKYLIAKKFDTEDTAAVLLRKSLENYQNQVEDKNGINNYWQQFRTLTPEINNDPSKWKSDLIDPKVALQFLKPLSCQNDNLKPCKGKVYVDGHIEDITSIWKNDRKISRNRKVSKKSTWCPESLNANADNFKENQLQKSENTCSVAHVDLNRREIFEVFSKRGIQKEEREPSISCLNNAYRKYPVSQQFSDFECKDAVKDNYKNTSLRNNTRANSSSTSRYREEEPETSRNRIQSFRTARDELNIQQLKANRPQKKTLGGRASVNTKFVCPLKREQEKTAQEYEGTEGSDEFEDERLKNIDRKMIELVKNEIMDSGSSVSWNNIAGLEYAKNTIKEVVVLPMLRPDIFTGLRCPPKGILLFGPPGTGKTLIGKCIASQSKSTFFAISASSLTSKWVGEGEKMVRALFAVAKVYQPAVIFIDEIDSLLSQRSDGEHESSRRIKTEFLVQLDGAATSEKDRILVVGATNRPQELDEAARRRLVKRLYIPLPELDARKQIIKDLLTSEHHNLTSEEIADIATLSEGYSGADMANLCKEASMGPIRSISFSQLENIRKEEVRQVTVKDFKQALNYVRSSVSKADLSIYVEWDQIYGTGSAQNYKS